MPTYYTTTQAAEQLACHRVTVHRVAKQHGIGLSVPTGLLLTKSDVAKLKKLVRQGPGNPNFGKKR